MLNQGSARQAIVALFLVAASHAAGGGQVQREFDRPRAGTGSLVIGTLPAISMRIDHRLQYLGAFPFAVEGIAEGHRYVWAELDAGRRAGRVFIVQREGYLPAAHREYSYPTRNPQTIGGAVYGHGVALYDNDVAAAQNPRNEASLTKTFFASRNVEWHPQTIMSRFARIVDTGRQNEIIFFYFEPLKRYSSNSIAELDALGSESPEVMKILRSVDRNARAAFSVVSAGH